MYMRKKQSQPSTMNKLVLYISQIVFVCLIIAGMFLQLFSFCNYYIKKSPSSSPSFFDNLRSSFDKKLNTFNTPHNVIPNSANFLDDFVNYLSEGFMSKFLIFDVFNSINYYDNPPSTSVQKGGNTGEDTIDLAKVMKYASYFSRENVFSYIINFIMNKESLVSKIYILPVILCGFVFSIYYFGYHIYNYLPFFRWITSYVYTHFFKNTTFLCSSLYFLGGIWCDLGLNIFNWIYSYGVGFLVNILFLVVYSLSPLLFFNKRVFKDLYHKFKNPFIITVLFAMGYYSITTFLATKKQKPTTGDYVLGGGTLAFSIMTLSKMAHTFYKNNSS